MNIINLEGGCFSPQSPSPGSAPAGGVCKVVYYLPVTVGSVLNTGAVYLNSYIHVPFALSVMSILH